MYEEKGKDFWGGDIAFIVKVSLPVCETQRALAWSIMWGRHDYLVVLEVQLKDREVNALCCQVLSFR